jgi:hypothetical protein
MEVGKLSRHVHVSVESLADLLCLLSNDVDVPGESAINNKLISSSTG